MKLLVDFVRAHLVESYMCLIAGAALAFIAFLKWRFATKAADWPAIAAKIENVFVDVLARGPNRSPTTFAVLAYEYSVGGEYYSGEIRLDAGDEAVKDAEKEFIGKELTVHYDPSKPAVSVFLKHKVRGWYVVKDRRLSLLAWLDNLTGR